MTSIAIQMRPSGLRPQGRAAAALAAERERRRVRTNERYRGARPLDEQQRRSVQNRVVLDHLELAESLAARFAARGGEQRDDLRQVAYFGLVKAARRFRPERGESFVSFAIPTVTGELRRYLRDQVGMVRLPRRLQELKVRVYAARQLLAGAGEPSAVSLAAAAEVDAAMLRELDAATALTRPASIAELGAEGEGVGAPDPGYDLAELRCALAGALGALDPRERLIVELRFGQERTQQQIADRLGVSQMQVSRLLERIMLQLRERLAEYSPLPTGEGLPITPRATSTSLRLRSCD